MVKDTQTSNMLVEIVRIFLKVVVICLPLLFLPAQAGQKIFKAHAITLYDEAPKYAEDFEHFDYVNPDAPKGGVFHVAPVQESTFDSFHPFIAKGNSFSTGAVETLMTGSVDEPFTQYGLIAESLEWPQDRSWVIFNLRAEAKWHDGKSISADDVVWSFETLIDKGNPQYRFYYSAVEKAQMLDERRVKFSFKEKNNKELPLVIGQLPILPKHYWQAHEFEKTTLQPPLGSGPYRIRNFEAGRYVIQERVEDYWGKDLAVNQGINNFDEIRTDFYRDITAIRLALKAGDLDFRDENQAKAWALEYDVGVVDDGFLIKESVSHQLPTGMQGLFMNTRRGLFNDPKVREALSYAFDFEWANRNLFFGQYTRTESYFSNSRLAATGLPTGQELEVLEKFRGRIPERVFNEVYHAPNTDGTGWPRENLTTAFALLKEAGWQVKDLVLTNGETGEPFKFEILLYSQAFERIMLPFVRNLKRLGIDARIRLVDVTQYINRLRSFDFDTLIVSMGQSENPGNEQREFWTTAAADQASSRNYAGIKDPVIDELVEMVIASQNRETLTARTRALDRVLSFGFYVVPNWYLAADRILYWDKFSKPDIPLKTGVMTSRWWFDSQKEEDLAKRMGFIDSGSSANSEHDEVTSNSGNLRWALLALLLAAGVWSIVRFLRRR